MLKRRICILMAMFLVVSAFAGCGSTDTQGTSSNTTPTSVAQSPSPTLTPLHVTSLTTTVTPDSFSGISCGGTASFTFSTVIAVAAGGSGGPLSYTWNIGTSHIPGTVTFAPADQSKTVSYTLKASSIQPDSAASVTGSLTVNNNGVALTSTPASASGICTFPGNFTVVSLTLSVSPASVTGIVCDSYITVVYTATVTIAPNTNGGTVLLKWSLSGTTTAVTFGPYQPGQTTRTITTTLTGKVIHNQVFPPAVSISTISPNALTSVRVKPFGPCIP